MLFGRRRAVHEEHFGPEQPDAPGAVGIEGDVDRHFMLKFGSAVMLGVTLGTAVMAVAGVPADRSKNTMPVLGVQVLPKVSVVLFCPTKVSRSWQAIEASGQFCVNVLTETGVGYRFQS